MTRRLVLIVLTLCCAAATARAAGFTATSRDMADGAAVPLRNLYGACGGENLSPDLAWRNAPEDTQSFAVTIFDPDTPTGKGWWHWAAFDIPRSVTSLPEGASGTAALQGSVEAVNDFGARGYGGPCPPQGDRPHHYVVTVYALRTARLDVQSLTSEAAAALLDRAALAKTSLTSTYGR